MLFKSFNRKLFCAFLSGLLYVPCGHAMEVNNIDINKLKCEIIKENPAMECMFKDIDFVNDIKVFSNIMDWVRKNPKVCQNHWAINEANRISLNNSIRCNNNSCPLTEEELDDFLNAPTNDPCPSQKTQQFDDLSNVLTENSCPLKSQQEFDNLSTVLSYVSIALKDGMSCNNEHLAPNNNKKPSSNKPTTSNEPTTVIPQPMPPVYGAPLSVKCNERRYFGDYVFSTKSFSKFKQSKNMTRKTSKELKDENC